MLTKNIVQTNNNEYYSEVNCVFSIYYKTNKIENIRFRSRKYMLCKSLNNLRYTYLDIHLIV